MCDRVITIHEAAKPISVAAIAPTTKAIVPLATIAQARRHNGVGRYSGT